MLSETSHGFYQARMDEAKMGAYYTDVAHCEDLSRYLYFSNSGETSVLEPSAGNCAAVKAVTGAKENSNIRIFAVELNDQTALDLKADTSLEDVLHADFLENVRIKNNAFSFVFGNPPYLNDVLGEEGPKVRIERQFLEKVSSYLKKDGVLVWVIPFSSFSEDSTLRYFANHYEIEKVFRFRESEFKKYRQVAVIARKIGNRIVSKDEMDIMRSRYQDLEKIAVLPEHPDVPDQEKIAVPESASSDVTLFAAKEFDVEAARRTLHDSMLIDLKKKFDDRIAIKEYGRSTEFRPPIPMKADSMYLLAVSGGGQGLTGSIENNDLHLQRGVAEVISESRYEEQEGSNGVKKAVEIVTTRTEISLRTIQQTEGKIDVLM